MCRVVTYQTNCAHDHREDTELEVENCPEFQRTHDLCKITRFVTYKFECVWCRSQAQGGLYPNKEKAKEFKANIAEAKERAKKRLDLDAGPSSPLWEKFPKSSLWEKAKKLVVKNP